MYLMNSETQGPFSNYEPKMTPNIEGNFNFTRTLLLSLSFFTVLLAWSYFNFKVPRILDDLISDSVKGKNTLMGIILALDNLVAVIVQPFFGNLSDRTRSKFGRRMPYIILGTTLAAFFFSVIPFVRVIGGLVLIILAFDCSMAIYRSVSIAILPDYTQERHRSTASSIQQFIANMGGVLAFAIPMILTMVGIPEFNEINDEQIPNQTFNVVSFLIVSILMLSAMIIQSIFIRETPTGDKMFELHSSEININPISLKVSEKLRNDQNSEDSIPVFQEIGEIFKSKEKSFRNMLFTVLFAYTGFAAVEAFFSVFAKDYMGKSESVSGTLFLAYSVPMILTALLWGPLGQMIGRKKAARIGLIGVIISASIFSIFLVPNIYRTDAVNQEDFLKTSDYLVMLNLAFISMPWMCFIVNSFPIVWSLAPEGKVGTYTGVYYTFNQFAYSLSPILAGLNLDFFNSLGPRQYAVLFPFVVVSMLIAFIFLLQVKSGDVKLTKAQIDEYSEKYIEND